MSEEVKPITLNVPSELAMARHSEMKTIIFFSTSMEDQLKAIETFALAIQTEEKCHHKIFMRPLFMNVFQFVRGTEDKDLIGAHEIIFCPIGASHDRLLDIKNIHMDRNCMCFVGENDLKKKKVKKIIDWLLEETEELKI